LAVRTTLSLDDDVLEKARRAAEKARVPFRHVINEALRSGLRTLENEARSVPYRTKPHRMGLKAGRNFDNVQELLAHLEGEAFK
jgi:hypothetical protein